MLPLLETLADGQQRTMREVTEILADRFRLSDEERQTRLPSGQQTIFSNRVAWAKTYMKEAGVLENPAWGKIQISKAGEKLLSDKPTAITSTLLSQYPDFVNFRRKSSSSSAGPTELVAAPTPSPADNRSTPRESIEAAYGLHETSLAAELLTRLRSCKPTFFEKATVDLLMAMGYSGVGGTGLVTNYSRDGGIDGVITQDKLGLDVVCIQAKRWENSVGRPVIQTFVGSLDLHRSKKGVVITTSTFTADARDFISRIEGKKVVLIDGEQLADLMIEYNLGVTTTMVYTLKDVSNDYFEEGEI